MGYPTELIAKAKYEMDIFERVASDTGAELIAEVERLRVMLKMPRDEYTHQCLKCFHLYNVEPDSSEDCPACGCDGKLPKQ